MRYAAPYPVAGGPDIVAHRALGGRHIGHHERTRPQRSYRWRGIAGMSLAVVAVPASWWALLTGAGIHRPAEPRPSAPAVQPAVTAPTEHGSTTPSSRPSAARPAPGMQRPSGTAAASALRSRPAATPCPTAPTGKNGGDPNNKHLRSTS